MKEPVLSPALTGQNGDHVATLDGIAATLGTPGGARELQARLDQSGRGDPEMQSEQAQVNKLLEEAAATVDPWALLDQIEKGVPLKEGETLPRARLGLYDQAIAAITNEHHDATREMLCKRASQVFEGVPLAKIRADVQRLVSPSAEQRLTIADPEPWEQPVNSAVLLHEIRETLERYVVLLKHGAVALTLWVVFTWLYDIFDVAPILVVKSPVKRCGKTKLFDILSRLVRRGITCSNITVGALYRTIEKWHPALIVDEADSFLSGRNVNEELRGVLNSGHTRATAFVIRCVGDEHEPRRFSTWGPRAIALIGQLPDTIEDRSIVIPMRRRRSDEHVARLRLDAPEFEVLRRKLAKWTEGATTGAFEPPVPDELDDRAHDNWLPLLAIAEVAGGDWPARARAAALALSGAEARQDDSRGVQLLADLRGRLTEENGIQIESVFTADLVAWLNANPERPWATWNRGRPITPKQVADLLRPFGIRPKQIRIGGESSKGYPRADCDDAFARYLPPDPKQGKQIRNDAELEANPDAKHESNVSGRERELRSRQTEFVSPVSGEKHLESEKTRREPVLQRKPVPR